MSIKAEFYGGPIDRTAMILPEMVYEYRVAVMEEPPYESIREMWSIEYDKYISPRIAVYKYLETYGDINIFIWKETK